MRMRLSFFYAFSFDGGHQKRYFLLLQHGNNHYWNICLVCVRNSIVQYDAGAYIDYDVYIAPPLLEHVGVLSYAESRNELALRKTAGIPCQIAGYNTCNDPKVHLSVGRISVNAAHRWFERVWCFQIACNSYYNEQDERKAVLLV